MGCFIVCARPVEFHQKMHNFVKKRNLSLLWLSPFSKMERPYGGPKDLGFFAFFFISVVISGWRGISPACGVLKHTNRSRWAFSPSCLPTTYPKPLSPVCPIEVLIFGGFCLVFVFWRWSWSHGVGYSCAIPRLIFAVISRARAWIILVKHHDCESQVRYTHFWDHFSKYVPHCILSIFSN